LLLSLLTERELHHEHVPGESFVHRQNLKGLNKQLEASTNEAHRKMLLRLLALEEARDEQLGQTGADLGSPYVGNVEISYRDCTMTSRRNRNGAA
jgi:hypothetical protein